MRCKYILYFFSCLAFTSFYSCKKEVSKSKTLFLLTNQISVNLYGFSTGTDKRLLIPVRKVGTRNTNYYSIFDTGSAGMMIDVTDILPASMITSSGIQFSGDSIQIDGITVTAQKLTMNFGNLTGLTKVYGNLGYSSVTVGSTENSLSIKRIPIFLYYKVIDSKGNQLPAHSNDIFGVGPGVSYANSSIVSPLSYVRFTANLTSGFKLNNLNKLSFTNSGTLVAGLLSIGLTNLDLSTSGFIMHPLRFESRSGFLPNIPATITYNANSVLSDVVFDTGTPSYSIIEDKKASGIGILPVNSIVTIVTDRGFKYQYLTSSTQNLTEIQNPNNTGDTRTIFSLDFFIKNEYLMDYQNHQIGLKNL